VLDRQKGVNSVGSQVVVFTLGTEEYGMPIDVVREITRYSQVRPVPHAPSYVSGLISIRGEAIPLIDLHERFNLPISPESAQAGKQSSGFALITEVGGATIGFAVDEVKEVRVLENLVPPPPLVAAPFIGGLENLPDRIIMQLVPDKILGEEELTVVSGLVDQ